MKNRQNIILLMILIIGTLSLQAQQLQWDVSYVKLEIKGMACPFCAGGMGQSFEALDGIQKVDMVFDQGLAILTVSKQNVPSKDILKGIVKKAGFETGEMQYSEKPFEIPVTTKKKKKKIKGEAKTSG